MRLVSVNVKERTG